MFDDFLAAFIFIATIKAFVWAYQRFSWREYIYSKEHPTLLRIEDLRKQYDGIDNLETLIKQVEKNPDVEVYVYLTYSDFAGGIDKEVKIPVQPNSRVWKQLCETEKGRLYKELGRAKNIFRLPFHNS
ncbi:MAG: hypothetical protein J6Y71_04520 [Ruminococcus sp.]|nr:hypothetical protein [Ruminococcus sp.]